MQEGSSAANDRSRRRTFARGFQVRIASSAFSCVKHHLRASEQRDGFAGFAVRHRGIPDLSRLSQMRCGGNALDRPLGRGAEVVGLQLNRGEALGSLRQARNATVSR